MSGKTGACDRFADSVAELALGTLVGEERAATLAHVDRCPNCRAALEGMALTADALLQIAPTAEPPVGFETRLFASLRTEPQRPARRVRLASGLGIAAAVALILGVGFGAGRLSSPTGPGAGLVVGHLTSSGHPRGEVVVAAGKPAWLVMTVEDVGAARTVECRVTLSNGRTIKVGTFNLASGYGEWTAPLAVGPDQIKSAELIGPDGSILAAAPLSR